MPWWLAPASGGKHAAASAPPSDSAHAGPDSRRVSFCDAPAASSAAASTDDESGVHEASGRASADDGVPSTWEDAWDDAWEVAVEARGGGAGDGGARAAAAARRSASPPPPPPPVFPPFAAGGIRASHSRPPCDALLSCVPLNHMVKASLLALLMNGLMSPSALDSRLLRSIAESSPPVALQSLHALSHRLEEGRGDPARKILPQTEVAAWLTGALRRGTLQVRPAFLRDPSTCFWADACSAFAHAGARRHRAHPHPRRAALLADSPPRAGRLRFVARRRACASPPRRGALTPPPLRVRAGRLSGAVGRGGAIPSPPRRGRRAGGAAVVAPGGCALWRRGCDATDVFARA